MYTLFFHPFSEGITIVLAFHLPFKSYSPSVSSFFQLPSFGLNEKKSSKMGFGLGLRFSCKLYILGYLKPPNKYNIPSKLNKLWKLLGSGTSPFVFVIDQIDVLGLYE
jgi:hypothetical protein